MSNESMSLQLHDLSSDQDWTVDPDMLEVSISPELVQKAETCVAFMQATNVDYVVIYDVFPYCTYTLAENLDEQDLKGKVPVLGSNGKLYVEENPKYFVEGCHARIYKNGGIVASLPFKHSSGELRGTVADLAELQLQLTQGYPQS